MSEKRFKLSDWCGEQSVSNVIDIEKQTHLTNIEVLDLLNEQQTTITELEEENEQLRRELDSFHPVMFQDMRKGTVVLYLKELE